MKKNVSDNSEFFMFGHRTGNPRGLRTLPRVLTPVSFFILAFFFIIQPCLADEIDNLIPYIIQVESGGDVWAVSDKGAIGLMQITPIVWVEWNNIQRLNYDEIHPMRIFQWDDIHFSKGLQLELGEWYLRRLKDKYKCDTLEKLLGAYNWGIGNVRKVNYDDNRFPKEVKKYIKDVLKLYDRSKNVQ